MVDGFLNPWEVASLCYTFKVGRSEFGKQSNEVQGLLNRQLLFIYKDNKCHAIGAHGNITNVTKICEKEVDTLKDGVDIFKGLLFLILENNIIRTPLTLQAEMCCQYEGDKRFRGFYVVSLNGKTMIHVDTNTGNWTQLDPRFEKIIEMWKKDGVRAAFLEKTTQGDCKTWLDELKLHWKDHPEPAGSASTVVIILCVSALIALIGLIILGVYCYLSRHPRAKKNDLQSSPTLLLDDSLTVSEMSSVKEEDEFLTASQNSVLLTSDQTGGNP
ncbi:UL16-binding protein 1-like [Mus pahari]|uniref:UL16-binding protein 1-like n=1 Tax=Mus pahari TaxID=10093 RepID=UPI001114F5E8|nr:UL16-binding protein 1-like [Mus pahari]